MAAGESPDGPGRWQRRGWWIAAGLAGLLVVGLVVLWVQAPALYGRGDAAKTAAATTRSAILTVAAALIAATAAGAGLSMTARTLAETQRANREADQRDRYAKSIKQLGSGKLDVRLGGIDGWNVSPRSSSGVILLWSRCSDPALNGEHLLQTRIALNGSVDLTSLRRLPTPRSQDRSEGA